MGCFVRYFVVFASKKKTLPAVKKTLPAVKKTLPAVTSSFLTSVLGLKFAVLGREKGGYCIEYRLLYLLCVMCLLLFHRQAAAEKACYTLGFCRDE